MKEWKEYTLDELYTFGNGLSKGSKFFGYGHPFVSFKTVFKNFFLPAVIEDLVDSNESERIKCSIQMGDVLLTRTSETVNELGFSSVALKDYPMATFNGFTKRMRPIYPDKIDNLYAGYYFRSSRFRNQICSMSNMVTRASLSNEMLGRLTMVLPPLETQTKIGNILNSLDCKIALNRQINDNLEQQAKALYKSWFVDFEPFCEGEFIESSLGSIPAGWKVGQLSEICEIVGGGTPSKSHPEYYCKRGIAWITPKDLSVSKSKFSSRGSEDITSDGYKNSSAKLMPRGTVLFSSRAPIGYISIATNEICTNQGFKSAVPGIAGTGYLYYFLQANTDKIESKASGSTFKEASGSLMKALEVIIPADGIFNQFEAELAPILNKQENIASEIQTLTTLRDTILPKLMSGELKINEIDC